MPFSATATGPQTQTHADEMFDAVFEKSPHFRIEMSYEDAQHFIRRIDEYNELRWEDVLSALDRVDRLIPRTFYGKGNPNNGQRSYEISVGREGSPVVYLERHEWRDMDRLSDDRLRRICQEMELTGAADEANFEVQPTTFGDSRKVTFRFWWD